MKAWRVVLDDCCTTYVLAETRGKATSRAIRESPFTHDWWDMDWTQVRTTRVPALDGEEITHQALFDMDRMWILCDGCERQVSLSDLDDDDQPVWADPYHGFCSQRCLDRKLERFGGALPHWPREAETIVPLCSEY